VRKYLSLLLIPLLLLTGCMKSKEHILIKKDGSGTLFVDLTVPKETRELIDNMLGGLVSGMAQAMQGMAEGMGAPPQEMETPELGSVSDEMFGNKAEILKKAKAAGLNVAFRSFEKKESGGDLLVSYEMGFDDINALARSGIVGTQFALLRNDAGDIVFKLLRDEKRAAQDKQQAKQFKSKQSAPGPGSCPMAKDAQKIKAIMKDFSVMVVVTMPNAIQEMTPGIFKKEDDATASFAVSGDFLEDPSIINKMHFIDAVEPSVICSGEGVTFEPGKGAEVSSGRVVQKIQLGSPTVQEAPAETQEGSVAPDWSGTVKSAAANGRSIRIHLKSGSKIEGPVVEHNDESVKVDCVALAVTIFAEEIQDVEEMSE